MMGHSAIVFVTILCVGCANIVEEPQFNITSKRIDDNVKVTIKNDHAVFSIHSPFGISQAVIERTGKKWPDAIVLRLHLKGLENFKVTNGTITLEATVSSQDGKVRQWKDGKEDSLLDAESPYWMEIRLVGKDGKPVKTIPLDGGYFELQLPKALFKNNPKSITVNWIDFYR